MNAHIGNRYRKARKTKDKPTLRDKLMGRRVMMARHHAGLRQVDLSKLLGVTQLTLHKYENGIVKISASRLIDLSRHLEVPIEYFYRDFAPPETLGLPPRRRRESEGSLKSDRFTPRESVKLLMDYYAIADEEVRHTLFGTLRKIAALSARLRKAKAAAQ